MIGIYFATSDTEFTVRMLEMGSPEDMWLAQEQIALLKLG